MKLSIIVPVYRTESTLDRCLQSIVGQDFGDYELVLVDDASPDGSPALCDAWDRRDSRIRVVHRPVNGGLSDARNTGIELARGEYLTFVDSDDYLGQGTLQAVMDEVGGHDLLEYPIYRHYGSPRQTLVTFPRQTFDDMGRYWLDAHAYEHTYACNKVYRRELFAEVRFPAGRVFEDVLTLPRLLARARRVGTTSRGCYYYCWNGQGITATADGEALGMLLSAHQTVSWMDDRYYMHLLNIQFDVCNATGQAPVLPLRRVNPLGASLTGNQRIKALLLQLLGMRLLCKLNKTLHKLRRHHW